MDSAWGLGFVLVGWFSFFLSGSDSRLQVAAAFLVSFWGFRLFWHVTARNLNKPEDARYVAMREKWGRHKTVKSFFYIFMLQGALLLLVSTPVIAIMNSTQPSYRPLGWLGLAIWVGGICIEMVADWQLRHFIQNKKRSKDDIMESGLWRYSRHPNYFGEIMTWWGSVIAAISVHEWWGILGALAITFLITKVSGVPMLENRYSDNKAYQDYRRKTSVLIPLPPRGR